MAHSFGEPAKETKPFSQNIEAFTSAIRQHGYVILICELIIFGLLAKIYWSVPGVIAGSLLSTVASLVLTTAIIYLADPIFRGITGELDKGRNRELAIEITKAVVEKLSNADRSYVQDAYQTFDDIPWEYLMRSADKIDICTNYFSSEWHARNADNFQKFFSRGGHLRLFLPDTHNLHSRVIDHGDPRLPLVTKAFRTAQIFQQSIGGVQKGIFEVFSTRDMPSYFLAQIAYASSQKTFLISPFGLSKLEGSPLPPAISFDVSETEGQSELIKRFAAAEVEALEHKQSFPLLESARYINWDTENDRVLVSLSLSCTAKCSFCYIESIVHEKGTTVPSGFEAHNLPTLIVNEICYSSQFKKGTDGTAILLGSFTDPFSASVFPRTLEFLNLFCAHNDNLVHIATKFALNDASISQLERFKSQLIVNYSVSSVSGVYEKGASSFKTKLESMAALLSRGFKVTGYLKPVLPQVTLKDAPEIMKQFKTIGLGVVVAGDLYLDDAISQKLKGLGVSTGLNPNYDSKKHVLDPVGRLKKIKQSDVDDIAALLSGGGFRVFRSSVDVVSATKRGELNRP